MRSKITLGLIVVMLAGLVAALVLRPRVPHAVTAVASEPDPSATAVASTSAAPSAAAGAPPHATAAATALPTGSATVAQTPAASAPSSSASTAPNASSLGRPLRVVAASWPLAAPGIVANDGMRGGAASVFTKTGTDVEINVIEEGAKLQNALARGGEDQDGADVALLPLQSFVAAYEGLKALDPVVFFVVGWSQGDIGLVAAAASLEALPAGNLKLYPAVPDANAFVALYVLDLTGISFDRVARSDNQAEAQLWALPREQATQLSGKADRQLLLTTGDASRLVPYVAVAKAALLSKQQDLLTAWAAGWLNGQEQMAADASAAARRIAAEAGGPEPLALLAQLGGTKPASLADNALAAGISGHSPVTLRALFDDSWRIWRAAEVLTIPPAAAPINSSVIASLVQRAGEAEPPSPPAAGASSGTAAGQPIVVHRVVRNEAGKLDDAALIAQLGMLSGVFARSPLRLTVFGDSDTVDAQASQRLIEKTAMQYKFAGARLSVGKAVGKQGVGAVIEILPVP